MANKWFKFYGGEYLSDPKIERLTPAERSCWITLLSLASMTDTGVVEFLTVDGLLTKSGIQKDPYNEGDWEKCRSVLEKFSGMKMIKVTTEDGKVTILNWDKRQEHNLTVAERVAKHRENKKRVTTNVTSVTTDQNRIDKNRIDSTNIIPTAAKAAVVKKAVKEYKTKTDPKTVVDLIELFKPVNEMTHTLYRQSSQRRAIDDLMKTANGDIEGLKKAISMLPAMNASDKVFTKITTPVQMVNGWAKAKSQFTGGITSGRKVVI